MLQTNEMKLVCVVLQTNEMKLVCVKNINIKILIKYFMSCREMSFLQIPENDDTRSIYIDVEAHNRRGRANSRNS